MSNKKGGFLEMFFTTIMPKVYGIGGAIVIIGALFKILHLPGADIMLILGLGTEALIFFFSAFEPPHHEPDWSKVYPELAPEYEGAIETLPAKKSKDSGDSVTKKLDHMLESAKIGPELLDSLGKGMRNLADTTKQMATLSNAAVATNEYAGHVKDASKALVEMNKSYSTTVMAMSEMANASKDAKEYHAQVQNVTKNLGALNAVYELELNDVNNHIKAMTKFYGNVAAAMDSMTQAGKDTEAFKNEVSKLTNNLTALNGIYGKMLTAMKG
ncbi:MAG: gliding motility protein GldL [Cytophagales bacterium]|nr:gliding motility protein GldL [Cytophagales bacterium]